MILDELKTIVEIATPVLTGVWWMAYRLARQDLQLEWQSRAIETLMRRGGSVPPPREKLMTLTDRHDGR